MEKYRGFSLSVISLVASLLVIPSALFSKISSPKPGLNVLLITIDTLRPDRLSCYQSSPVQTPNIDSLADKGVVFSRAFAHTPTTLPSHANILLGVTPPDHGVHDNANFMVREEFLTLAEHLHKLGYLTAAFVGAFPLDSRFGLTQGFDLYDDNYGSQGPHQFTFVERRAEVVVDRAIRWLEGRQAPWFLWIHCFDPHQRYDPPEPFKTKYKNNPYDGEVAYVDFALGRLFSHLRDKKWEEKTLILFTADHGESLGEHGEMTHGYFGYNATLWVPLIISFPGVKAGRTEENVCHVDLFPTVCEILGIEEPGFLRGLSLLPALKGKALPERPIYFESLSPYYTRGWAPLRGIIRGNGKFIDSPIPEFYDLEKDFEEKQNLADSENLAGYREKLREFLQGQSSSPGSERSERIDREAREKLQSLGYITGTSLSKQKDFTAADDLKVLLPYQNRLMKAMVAHFKGQIEEGILILKEIISERTDFDQAYTHLASLYKEQRKLNEALEVLREGYEKNPMSFRIITTYGINLAEAGLSDEAISILKKGLALIDYDPEAWNYLGVAYWNKGEYEEALQAYRKALSLDHNYPFVFNNLGSLYLSLFLKTKKPDALQKAIENFKKALELDPGYASAYNGLGAALKMAGDLEAAINAWKMVLELEPDHAYAHYNLGLACLAKGDKAQALVYFTKYKNKHYRFLPPGEREKLDSLIQKCK